MRRLRDALDRLAVALMALGGLALVALMFLVSLDVAGKYLLAAPIPGTLEVVSSYLMVSLVYLPIGFVQLRRQHLMVELFTMGVPPRAKAGLDVLVGALAAVYVGLLSWLVFNQALDATAIREFRDVTDWLLPVWPARWLLPLAFGLMFLVTLAQTLIDLAYAVTGRGEPTFREIETAALTEVE
ncbi:TRAP transporter small permease [uncultured Albimonas sp.]|uniref:TRAP transporter small permease subunit n=1 Tax=uncultured Albimonas sp. TaxID=1331701 RepID=UPI0030EB97D5